jgi:hypothetical protein
LAQDTTYIQQFPRQRNIQLNTWLTDVDFTLNPNIINGSKKVTFTPNVRSQVGISTGFKWFTLSLGVQVPGTELPMGQYGRTQYFDFYFGAYKKQFGGEIYYRNFHGVYRQPVGDIPGTSIPDAQLSNFGLTFLYVFNKDKFSMRSAIAQLELQRKSAGSFILFNNYNYRGFNSEANVIPDEFNTREIFGEMRGLRKINFYTVNIRPGYAHNFVIRNGKWFISPSAFVGVGMARYDYRSYSGVNRGFTFDADAHMKLSAGYNQARVFFNFFVVLDQNFTIVGGNSSSLQTRSYGFNLAYRLNSFFKLKWL